MAMKIPAGKTVKIKQYKGSSTERSDIDDINDASFLLASEFTMDITSDFAPIMNYSPSTAQVLIQEATQLLKSKGEGFGSKVVEKVKQAGEIVGGYYDWMGAQIWTKTSPVTSKVTVQVLPTNKSQNILVPVKALLKLVVPKVSTKTSILGNKPLIFPGPNIFKELGYGNSTDYPDAQNEISIEIGHILMDRVVITSVNPVFSEEIDENGIPEQVTLDISFQTSRICTDQMIDNIFSNVDEELK